jgi:flagellar motor switch protein FliN/FliY
MSSSPTSSSSSDAAAAAVAASAPAAVPGSPFDVLGDLRCPVTVLLGAGSITVRECLNLQPGGVLRLAQSAGEDLHVFVNGIAIARAEVAIIDTTTAVRITDLAPAPGGLRRSA